MNGLFRTVLLLFCTSTLWGANAFFGQSSAGSGSGADCADQRAYTSHVSGDDAPGNTNTLCGTISVGLNTTVWTFLGDGSGAAGGAAATCTSPVTLKFAPGAVLTSPAWPNLNNGAIDMAGHSCIVIDGGTNGTIQATANGDALANQINSNVVGNTAARTGTHQITQNLTLHNIFIKVQNNTSTADDSLGIGLYGSNALITHNTLDHMSTGIGSGNGSNIEISFNTFSAISHAITHGCADSTCGGGINNILVHDNVFQGGNQIYDESGDGYHRNDAIFQTTAAPSSLGTCFTGLQYYNNYAYGIMSVTGQSTARLFLDDEVGSCKINALVYNNIFSLAAGDGGISNGFIDSPIGGAQMYNNSFVTPYTGGAAGNCFSGWDVSNTIAKNNLAIGCNGAYYPNDPGLGGGIVFDFNMYNQVSNAIWTIPNSVPQCNLGNCAFSTFAQWQGYGLDAHSVNNTDPGVVNATNCSTGTLSACKLASTSSNAHNFGTNLTSLGITGLTTDAAGLSRPSVGNWDLGAFQVGGPAVNPTSLSGLPWTNTQVIGTQTLTSSGFSGTVTWSKLSGTQPTGLGGTCITGTTGNTCTMLGTLSAAGTFTFTIRATDGTNIVDTLFNSVLVNAVPSITTTSMPNGSLGVAYSKALATSGGTGAITCALTSGSLPNGLSLTGSTCTIAGTPTVVNNFPFSVTPTDANGISGLAQNLSITILGTCSITPTTVGPFNGRQTVNVSFSQTGCNASTFTVCSGSLSGSGLSLSTLGVLTGTAIQGTFNPTVCYDTGTDPVTVNILPSVLPATTSNRSTVGGKSTH